MKSMLRVNYFLPPPLPLLQRATRTRRRDAGKNSRLTVGLIFARRCLIASFHPALRRHACRLWRSRDGERRLILGDGEVALSLYIVHSSEINVRPGNISGIRPRST